MSERLRIAVLGAGSIGCYVGGRLATGGSDVVLIGRPSLRDACATDGLTLTDLTGFRRVIPPEQIHIAVEPTALKGANVVLLAVKSLDTASAADQIKEHAPADAMVISLQNGVRNPTILRDRLEQVVVAGMVPFNVVRQSESHFHCGTEGCLVFEQTSEDLSEFFRQLMWARIPAELHDNITGVQWGKLLMNLNNPLVALTGLSLAEELRNRTCRRVLALSIGEGLRMLAQLPQLLT